MNIEIVHLPSLLKTGVMTIKSSLIQQLKHNKTAAVAVKEPLIKSWMNSLSPEFPIAALASTCNSPAHKHISIALENSESQSASPRLDQRLP